MNSFARTSDALLISWRWHLSSINRPLYCTGLKDSHLHRKWLQLPHSIQVHLINSANYLRFSCFKPSGTLKKEERLTLLFLGDAIGSVIHAPKRVPDVLMVTGPVIFINLPHAGKEWKTLIRCRPNEIPEANFMVLLIICVAVFRILKQKYKTASTRARLAQPSKTHSNIWQMCRFA